MISLSLGMQSPTASACGRSSQSRTVLIVTSPCCRRCSSSRSPKDLPGAPSSSMPRSGACWPGLRYGLDFAGYIGAPDSDLAREREVLPLPESPAGLSIGCSPAARRACGSDPHEDSNWLVVNSSRSPSLLRWACYARSTHSSISTLPRFGLRYRIPTCSASMPNHGCMYTRGASRLIITLLVLPAFLAVARQTDPAAAAYADRRPCRFVPDRDAGARPRRSHQPYPEGSLGPRASDRRAAIRRRQSFHAMVGPARRLPEQLFVHRRRTVGRVLDAGAGGVGAAAIAAAGLWRGARLRHGIGVLRMAAGAPFLHRRRVRRRVHVSARYGPCTV